MELGEFERSPLERGCVMIDKRGDRCVLQVIRTLSQYSTMSGTAFVSLLVETGSGGLHLLKLARTSLASRNALAVVDCRLPNQED